MAKVLEFQLYTVASLVAQRLKNLPAMQETSVQFLGLEDPLEKTPRGTWRGGTGFGKRGQDNTPRLERARGIALQAMQEEKALSSRAGAAHQASLSFTISQSLLKFTSVEFALELQAID